MQQYPARRKPLDSRSKTATAFNRDIFYDRNQLMLYRVAVGKTASSRPRGELFDLLHPVVNSRCRSSLRERVSLIRNNPGCGVSLCRYRSLSPCGGLVRWL